MFPERGLRPLPIGPLVVIDAQQSNETSSSAPDKPNRSAHRMGMIRKSLERPSARDPEPVVGGRCVEQLVPPKAGILLSAPLPNPTDRLAESNTHGRTSASVLNGVFNEFGETLFEQQVV